MGTPQLPRVQLTARPAAKHTRLRAGNKGVVTGYDFGRNLIEVQWDNGSRLSVPENITVRLDK